MVVFYVHYVFNPSIGAANPDRVAETNGPQQIQIQPVSSSEALGDDQWLNKTTGPGGGALLLITVHYIISMSSIFYGLAVLGELLEWRFSFALCPTTIDRTLGWLPIRVSPISEQSIYDSRGIKCGLRGAVSICNGTGVWLLSVALLGGFSGVLSLINRCSSLGIDANNNYSHSKDYSGYHQQLYYYCLDYDSTVAVGVPLIPALLL